MNKSKETTAYHAGVLSAVEEGLSKQNKLFPSWLLYDEIGDKLFQDIMDMPEYYLTQCELNVFQNKKDQIAQLLSLSDSPFNLVELGAGNGVKTDVLLHYFSQQKFSFTYLPVDVSGAVLDELMARLEEKLPDLDVRPQNTLYYDALRSINTHDDKKKVLLFLGANIGNFSKEETQKFVAALAANIAPNDWLLMGFDLKKNPRLIQSAYDDKGGISRAFTLNLLERLNRELGAQFDIAQFDYYSSYSPETGAVKNYLISQQDQEVFIEALDTSFHFDQWEAIHTETSQKYDLEMINALLAEAGLEVAHIFYDEKNYFCDVAIQRCKA